MQSLTVKQREGTLTALYRSMFNKKQHKVDVEGYKLKHGRGEDFNQDIMAMEQVELEEIEAEKSFGRQGYCLRNFGAKYQVRT